MKDYKHLMDSFFGEYSEEYCKENGLFIVYDMNGRIEKKTKQFIAYQRDVIGTDLSFILGEWQEISADEDSPDQATDDLQRLLDANDWEMLSRFIVLQGLILGTTGVRVGRDADENVRVAFIDLMKTEHEPIYRNDTIVGWRIVYENDEGDTIEEINTDQEVVILKNDEEILRIPNRYNRSWIRIFPNRPTIIGERWQGESEWNNIRALVDEINAIHSRISRIEDLYANPRLLAIGIEEGTLRKDDNVYYVSDSEAKIEMLEFSGNVIPSMLDRAEKLTQALKDKCPELILNDLGQASGYALRLKLEKLQKKISGLKQNYFSVFEDVFELMYEMETQRQAKFELVASSPIPENVEDKLKELMIMHEQGIVSLRTFATEMGYNYDEEQKRLLEEGAMLPSFDSKLPRLEEE